MARAFRQARSQRIPHLAKVTAASRTPAPPQHVQKNEPGDGEENVRHPHRNERTQDELVRQRLSRNEANVVQPEYRKARSYHEAHSSSRKAQRHGRTEEYEDQAGCGERKFLFDLHLVLVQVHTRVLNPAACRLQLSLCNDVRVDRRNATWRSWSTGEHRLPGYRLLRTLATAEGGRQRLLHRLGQLNAAGAVGDGAAGLSHCLLR